MTPDPAIPDPGASPQRPDEAAYRQMLEQVRRKGAYPDHRTADTAVRAVLAALGRQLTGDERVDLAACLPLEAARVLTTQPPDLQPLAAQAFVTDLAARTGAPMATARWDAGSVLAAIADHIGPDLLSRILDQLPTGYALLFGRAELTPTATTATREDGADTTPPTDRHPGL